MDATAKLLPAAQPLTLAEARGGDWAYLTEKDIERPVDVGDPDGGKWIVVTNASTNVDRFRYDVKTKRLYVTFQGKPPSNFKAAGFYSGVPIETYLEFKESPSFGSYVCHRLRNRYAWTRLNYEVL